MPATQPAADGPDVRVTVVAMEKPTRAIGDPIGTHVRLVSVAHGSTPVLPVATFTDDVRIIPPDGTAAFERNLKAGALGRTATLPVLESVLATGVTSTFEVSLVQPQTDALSGKTAHRRFQLELSPDSQGRIQTALVVEDFIPVESNLSRAILQTESVLLDPIEQKSPAMIMIVPFVVSETRAFALTVEIGQLFDAQRHEQLVADCQKNVRAAAATATALPTTLPTDQQFAIQNALNTLARHPDDRPALVFLADETDAHLCSRAAIVAEKATLSDLSQAIVKRGPGSDLEQTGWRLDRSTLELLSTQLAAEKLPPELAAVLTDYAGEAGRHAASISEALRGPDSRAAIEATLVAENLIFLEDSSPAARVRAYDWLNSHGKAPKGYDPLGTPRERHAALENALAAAATQPAEGGKP
jgi:hypothetical protein